ncbi:MAG: tetratricopeptide repeat protein [Deltaproteobacteria bacterium]|nr:tetratricopeptide repeat protein [Deltaproteobacteria bacterium]
MRKLLLTISLSLISGFLYANSDIEITKAYGYYKLQKYEEAIKICEVVLEKERDNNDALYLAGISNFMMKNYLEADKYFQRFILSNPYNYEIIKYSAIAKYYNQDYKGSVSYFEKIPKYSDDPLILLYLALNYNRLQDKDNLQSAISKIEKNPKITHQNKKEFLEIINKAMAQDAEGTLSGLKNLRDKYSNQFIITSKIISIEKNTKQESSDNFKLMLSVNEVFDTNVALYPDKDAVKLPEVKYAERYDLRTEARYSIGYRFISTSNNILGIVYNGYQGINSNFSMYNFNANNLELIYKYIKPEFHFGFKYNYTYDFISDKFKAYAFGHKVTPEFAYNFSNSVLALGAPVHLRHYFEKVYSKDYNRSSLLIDPYLYFSHSFTPNFTIYNKDFFGINNAEGDGWKYMRPEATLGIIYKYGKSLIFNASGGFGYYMFSEKISNPDYLFDNNADARTDMRFFFETGIDIRLFSDKLFLNTGYAFIMNMSDVKSGIYDYSRHIGSAGLKFVY